MEFSLSIWINVVDKLVDNLDFHAIGQDLLWKDLLSNINENLKISSTYVEISHFKLIAKNLNTIGRS